MKDYTFVLELVVQADNYDNAEKLLFKSIRSKLENEREGLILIKKWK